MKTTPEDLLPRPLDRMLATFFGSGRAPFMPGTFGSLAAVIPLYWVPAAWWPWAPALGCVAATLISAAISRRMPPKELGGDPGWFVLDEAAGVWLAAVGLVGPSIVGLTSAFLLFRLFDITKPPPVRFLEKAPAGYGIVVDDLAAAGYALALLILARMTGLLPV